MTHARLSLVMGDDDDEHAFRDARWVLFNELSRTHLRRSLDVLKVVVHNVVFDGRSMGEHLLYLAINEGEPAVVARLLQAEVGANVLSIEQDEAALGCRVLHALTEQGCGPGTHSRGPQMATITKLLLDSHADVNSLMRTPEESEDGTGVAAAAIVGRTPLQLAIEEAWPTSPYVISALMTHGGARVIDAGALHRMLNRNHERGAHLGALASGFRRWRKAAGYADDNVEAVGYSPDPVRVEEHRLVLREFCLELALLLAWWREVTPAVRQIGNLDRFGVSRRGVFDHGELLSVLLRWVGVDVCGNAARWAELYNSGYCMDVLSPYDR